MQNLNFNINGKNITVYAFQNKKFANFVSIISNMNLDFENAYENYLQNFPEQYMCDLEFHKHLKNFNVNCGSPIQKNKKILITLIFNQNDSDTKSIFLDNDISFFDFNQLIENKFPKYKNITYSCGNIMIDDDYSLKAVLKNNLTISCSSFIEDVKLPILEIDTKSLNPNPRKIFIDYNVICASYFNNNILIGGLHPFIDLVNVQDFSMHHIKNTHKLPIKWIDIFPDHNKFLTASEDKTIKIWSMDKKNKIVTLKGHSDIVSCSKVNSTGTYAISSSFDNTVKTWCIENSKSDNDFKHNEKVSYCSFSNTDNSKYILSCSDDKTAKIWSFNSKNPIMNFNHSACVLCSNFSADDKYIVTSTLNHEVKLWDIRKNLELRKPTYHHNPVLQACFICNDKFILSRSQNVKLNQSLTGEDVNLLEKYNDTTFVTHNNNNIVICEKNGNISFIDI